MKYDFDEVEEACEHEWTETDRECEICGEHDALICYKCCAAVDLVYYDDPREA